MEREEPKQVEVISLMGLEQPKKPKLSDAIVFLLKVGESFTLPETLIDFAQEKIKEGNSTLKKIEQNPKLIERACEKYQKIRKEMDEISFLTQQKIYLDEIIAVAWALFNRAVEKGQGFTGGTIVVIDPEFALFNFLFNYVCFVNPQINPEKNPANIISSNLFGYSRKSTHFTELKSLENFEGQYGIDIRYDGKNLEPLLPSNKAHILFAKLPYVDIPLTFIKFETYGLVFEGKDMIRHVGKAIIKGKKDILKTHIQLLSRREDIPEEVIKRFKNLVKQLPKKEKARVKEAIAKKFDHIRTYYIEAKRLSTHSEKYAENAQQFVKYLENHYDYLDLRRGDEVILDLRDFA
jgi:predicted DNA-binding protein